MRGPLLLDNHRSSRVFATRKVLVVDPDEAFGEVLQPLLGEQFVLLQQASVTSAIAAFDTAIPDAVLLNLDTVIPAESTLLLRSASDREMPFPVIAYSWQGGGEMILNAFRDGVFDTLSQPLDVQQLRFALDRASRRSALTRELFETRRLLGGARVEGLLGNSKAIERVSEVTLKVAEVFTSVLVTGESGTG
jgi:DNA-binding NtrC family response regulator